MILVFGLQIYRGTETRFTLDTLQPRTDYHVRVCAIRECEGDCEELPGAFSPGSHFTTLSPEPVKPVQSTVAEDKVTEKRILTDQHLVAIFLLGFVLVAVLIAFIVSQFFPGSSSHDEVWPSGSFIVSCSSGDVRIPWAIIFELSISLSLHYLMILWCDCFSLQWWKRYAIAYGRIMKKKYYEKYFCCCDKWICG